MVGSCLVIALSLATVAVFAPAPDERQLELNSEARAQIEEGEFLRAADTWIEALALAVTDLDVQNHFCGALGALARGLDEGADREAIGERLAEHRSALEASAERLRRVDAVDNQVCLEQWGRLDAAFGPEEEAPDEEAPDEEALDEAPASEVEAPAEKGGALRLGLMVAGAVTASGAAAALATGFGAAHDSGGGFQGFAYKRVYDAAPADARSSGRDLCDGAMGELAEACRGYEHTRRAFVATAVITGLGAVTIGVLTTLVLRRGGGRLGSRRAALRIVPDTTGASIHLRF